ncbi:MAG: hypothetical protein C0442_10325 [Chlorobiaceae bacterium]|nr:hypothetical protein [Chlorobiaceae bacterium]
MPIGLAATFIFLAVTVGFFTTIWAVIKIESNLLGFQNHELAKKMVRVFLISLTIYIFIFIIFLVIGKLSGPSAASKFFLDYGLPITWLLIAPLSLGRAIQTPEGVSIGKMRATFIFIGALVISFLFWSGLIIGFKYQ